MWLTKREQLLGLRMLQSQITKTDQDSYISHAFYVTICKLKRLKLVRSEKNGRNCSYILTDDGKILFSEIAGFEGNEEFKKFAIKGTKIITFS